MESRQDHREVAVGHQVLGAEPPRWCLHVGRYCTTQALPGVDSTQGIYGAAPTFARWRSRGWSLHCSRCNETKPGGHCMDTVGDTVARRIKTKPSKPLHLQDLSRADAGSRTPDLLITNQLPRTDASPRCKPLLSVDTRPSGSSTFPKPHPDWVDG